MNSYVQNIFWPRGQRATPSKQQGERGAQKINTNNNVHQELLLLLSLQYN